MVEQPFHKRPVIGSIPIVGTNMGESTINKEPHNLEVDNQLSNINFDFKKRKIGLTTNRMNGEISNGKWIEVAINEKLSNRFFGKSRQIGELVVIPDVNPETGQQELHCMSNYNLTIGKPDRV